MSYKIQSYNMYLSVRLVSFSIIHSHFGRRWAKWVKRVQGYKISVINKINLGDVIYSMVTTGFTNSFSF